LGQELAGKVAIVTGGANGIGRATVEAFVAEGAKIVIADVNEGEGLALAQGLGEAALFKRTDVSKPDEVQAVVDTAVRHFGGLHIMVNNAGIGGATCEHFLDDELKDFDRVVGVNLLGVMLGCQRAGRHMAKNGGGAIVNFTSIAALQAGYGVMTYRAAKAGVVQFTKSVAIDFAEYGIRVNCIAPGHIRTALNAFSAPGISAETAARLAAAHAPVWDASKPLKRQGSTADVAQAVLFLASDRAAQITGTILPVDGGIVAGDAVNHLAALLAVRASVLGS
jgi:NAD(P)-dependent dehydrogenase (short-subunit alcohol dehydrogenase family)